MENVFSHAVDLTLWIPPEDLINCFLVCTSWRAEMHENPFIWTRLLVWRWKIFKCVLGPGQRLKADIAHEAFLQLVSRLEMAPRHPVFDLRSRSSERHVTHCWSGFNNGVAGFSTSTGEVVDTFKRNGYEVSSQNESTINFRLANDGVWLFLNVARMSNHIWCSSDEDQPSQEPNELVYFNKLSLSVVSGSSITWGWSGYNNGRAQKSLPKVMRDFRDRGFDVVEDTSMEVIFRKQGGFP